MTGKLHFRILTPTREVLSRQVDYATLTAAEGEVGILPGHAALLAALKPGEAWFRDGAETGYFALSDGFLEVSNDVVTALVRSAEPSHEMDVVRAERKRAEAEARLKEELDERELEMALASVEKQVVRIQVARRMTGS